MDDRSLNFREVNRERPCEVCGKPDWCRRADDGAIECHRTTDAVSGFKLLKVTASGFGLYRLESDDTYRPATAKPNASSNPKPATLYATPEAAVTAILRFANMQGGKYAGGWDYHDAGGVVVMRVVRFDFTDGKQFRPLHRVGDQWAIGDPPGKLPLYGLPDLNGAPRVVVTEGERCVEAVRELGWTGTTSSHGSKSARKTDWTPLAGKDVIISPDADEPGELYGQDVTDILLSLDPPARVKVIRLPGLTEGQDIVDFRRLRTPRETREAIGPLIEAAPLAKRDHYAGTEDTPTRDANKKPSCADRLVMLATELYRLGQTPAGEPFAVARDGPNLAKMLRGSGGSLRATLAAVYREVHTKIPNSTGLADALLCLEGMALATEPEPVHLRVTAHGGGVVLDLGRPDGQAVTITPGGWSIVDPSPVLFRRTELTGALPDPMRGGDLAALRRLINVTDETWPAVVGWLVSTLSPSMTHPIVLLTGLEGTGKSTAARMLTAVVDPSPALLRTAPRDVEGWSVAASGSWIVPIDNVSHIPAWWSDALCRAASGDGLVRRRLYSDSALSVLTFRRCVLLTSIDVGALRGDLGSRLLLVDLERISDGARLEDSQLDAAFEAAHPGILGGLCDLACKVLAALPAVRPAKLPRLADFGRLLAAVDHVLGTDAFGRLCNQRARIVADVIDSDPVALAVQELLQAGGTWTGTAGDLLTALWQTDARPPKGWPANARALSSRLRRLIPALNATGIKVTPPDGCTGHGRDRLWDLRAVASGASTNANGDRSPKNAADDPQRTFLTDASGASTKIPSLSDHGMGGDQRD